LKLFIDVESGRFKPLSALGPGKQGLKPIRRAMLGVPARLSALDPGKQGLKLLLPKQSDIAFLLSALDPGKQGLKQIS